MMEPSKAVKALFPKPMTREEALERWVDLERTIKAIQAKGVSEISFESLYRNSYQMVLSKHGEILDKGVQGVVTSHLNNRIRKKVEDAMAEGNFLPTLIHVWGDHLITMVMISDILMYLDRMHLKPKRDTTVFTIGLDLFRTNVLVESGIGDHLTTVLLQMIASERRGEAIPKLEVRNACHMLMDLGSGTRTLNFYENLFEVHLLKETHEFYEQESQKFLSENSASTYLKKVEECLLEESQRAKMYLAPSSEDKLLKVLEEVLIKDHMTTIVDMDNSGMISMLVNEQIDDLRRMFNVLQRVDGGIKTMTACLSKYLRKKGTELVTAPSSSISSANNENKDAANSTCPISFIRRMLNFKGKFDHFLIDAFNSDRVFKDTIDSDFEHFFNLEKKSAEFLSLYIHDLLTGGMKEMNEAEADVVLDKALALFRYLREKDVFERYYKQHLAKRLLCLKTRSADSEKAMITKLKTECGYDFTSKLEGMFRDMDLSHNLMCDYREFLEQRGSPGPGGALDMSVKVLTHVHWPTEIAPACSLPPSVAEGFSQFQVFYLNKHSGRKLTLNCALGVADVKAVFYNRKVASADQSQEESGQAGPLSGVVLVKEEHKILQVCTYQMVVLLCFNEKARFTFEELLEATAIPEPDLKRALASMAMGKLTQRVLCRRGSGKEIENGDEFIVNDGFTSRLTRIRVKMVSGRMDTEPERQFTRMIVHGDRKQEMEAAIVRIMKSRKNLLHNQLITEVTNQLSTRFLPDPLMVKKAIESLINRDYMERDPSEHRMYIYKA